MLLFLDDSDPTQAYEVPDTDCELAEDGSGCWYLAADGEDTEDFYVFFDVSLESEDDDAE